MGIWESLSWNPILGSYSFLIWLGGLSKEFANARLCVIREPNCAFRRASAWAPTWARFSTGDLWGGVSATWNWSPRLTHNRDIFLVY